MVHGGRDKRYWYGPLREVLAESGHKIGHAIIPVMVNLAQTD